MTDSADSLACLFSARVHETGDGDYRISIPKRARDRGDIDVDASYRIAVVDPDRQPPAAETETTAHSTRAVEAHSPTTVTTDSSTPDAAQTGPPVAEGDRRTVSIETLGDKGDGIAKVERGYVVIVPGAELGEEVTVEITSVRENVSFATVITDE